MASYAAVHGVMLAIEGILQERFPAELSASPISGSVQLFGSQDFKRASFGNLLALYLYRVSVDPTIPGGYVRALPGSGAAHIPEVPVMLHFLMISIADTPLAEISLMGWGFSQLHANPTVGADRLTDPALVWDDADDVQISTEELTREELMRIWDTLPTKYSLTVPYVARAVRVALLADMVQYPPVLDRTLIGSPS